MTFCTKTLHKYVVFSAMLYATSVCLNAQTKQLLTPEACTEIRYLASDNFTSLPPLQLSPDGTQVAYVLQVPDIASNDNKDELFVKGVNDESPSMQIPVAINEFIAAIRWFPDNRHLAVLLRRGGKVVLAQVDSTTKTQQIIWEAATDISDYSMDAVGATIAIAVRHRDHVTTTPDIQRDDRKGYRLDLASVSHSGDARRQVYILRSSNDGTWTMAQRVSIVSPLSGKIIDSIVDAHDLHVNISPDGQYLLMDNVESFPSLSQEGLWGNSPVVRYMRKRGFDGLVVSYLYDVRTMKASIPLRSPIQWDTLWAPDSKSYVKVALAPVGSGWESADLTAGAPNDHITHLFAVDVRTSKVSEVLSRAEKPPVAWTTSGDIIARDPAGVLLTLRRTSDQWARTKGDPIPLPDAAPYSPITSDGHTIVMEYENAHTPPELVAFERSSARWWTVAKLNPQADSLILPKSETITWTTSTGFKARGMLLLPPDYNPHRRYPLVIEDGSILYSGEFVCDSGAAHVSSFARGILADAGILYLTRYWPGNEEWESSYYPEGYPGSVAEAAFKLDLTESAIKSLDKSGIIDPSKVGLIGFSRGGWYVEYTLAHSHAPFEAATATDNVQYSMGEYWYWNNEGLSRNLEGMYGGPPYGDSLKNWLDFSISFNLEKIRTPLLMEVMGYGKTDDEPGRPPDNLAVHDEVFIGLSRLKKPVELYYYPYEQHQPDYPQARIASLQRNVDWYRFWLQGYERSDPEDPGQYKRWEHLRELQDAEDKAAGDVNLPMRR